MRNSIRTLIYSKEINFIEKGIYLASDYQAEGGSGAEQSWLLDLNEDGFTDDVLTRNYYEKYELKKGSNKLELIHKEKSYVLIFENSLFRKKLVKNKNLQKNLEKEFPFRAIDAPFMKEETQKGVLKLLKKGGLVIPSEND